MQRLVLFFTLVVAVNCFSSGAPPDVCVKDRFNQPNHGETRTQSLETIPYQIVASSARFKPGDEISRKKNLNC
jgi:hypothetical protein